MGYRSDVAIAIYSENDITDIISKFEAEISQIEEKDFVESSIVEKSNNRLILSFESVKWYDDYPLVQAINNVWKYAKQFDADGVNGEYVIIGEDLSDIEEQSFGDNKQWILSITRSIEINT